jgi:hypothetical protein
MSEEIRMTQPTAENVQKAEEAKRSLSGQVKHDAGTPRLALFVWLDGGGCHQVQLSMSDRRVLLDTIMRKHDYSLKVSGQEVGILWPERAEKEAVE